MVAVCVLFCDVVGGGGGLDSGCSGGGGGGGEGSRCEGGGGGVDFAAGFLLFAEAALLGLVGGPGAQLVLEDVLSGAAVFFHDHEFAMIDVPQVFEVFDGVMIPAHALASPSSVFQDQLTTSSKISSS